MTWESQYKRWAEAISENPYDDRPARAIVIETRKLVRNGGSLDNQQQREWVENALRDAERRQFVTAVFHKQAAPSALANIMLRMGVEEENPSTNRFFIEPAVKAIGARRVMRRLTELLRDGSDREKAGAASAAYWVKGDVKQPSYIEARARFRDELLRQIVTTESTSVQRRIIPSLTMQAEVYSTEVAKLLPVAIRIARTHSDPYIRHRVEVQLGEKNVLSPLPR